jgi:nitroreductase
VLDAGVCAPGGQHSQPWAFVVVTDDEGRRFFGTRYLHWMRDRFAAALRSVDDTTPSGRTIRAAMHLAEHMHEVPVLLFCCGRRDWPFAVPAAARVGKAPPSCGSVYPCVQNILLAGRGLGLGASLTTLHQMFDGELHAFFGIPEDHGVVAVIPIGFPAGRLGPVTREAAACTTHCNRWGGTRPGLAEPAQ